MKKAFLILFYIVTTIYYGLSQQYNFHNYSVTDGVAQSQVYGLLQDSRGYLWLGTRGGGISQFDGTGFKTYSVKDGLSNNYIYCIKEDKEHNLWFGTNNGLSKYNGIIFENFQPSGDTGQVGIQDIDFDTKGRKWLATNIGVIILDKKNFVNISDLLKVKKTLINTIHVDKNGNIWYGCNDGLFKISEVNSNFILTKFSASQGYKKNMITCISEDNDGNIWYGTYGDGVYYFDSQKFFHFDNYSELNKQVIFDIYFDKYNNIWFATLSHGVGEYNKFAKTLNWLTEEEGLSNNHVRCIIQDKSDNYWFGTSGGGVCNYFGKLFTNYDKLSGLAGNFIYCIFRDSKKRLWIGTSNKGLSVLDSGKFFNYNSSNGFADVKVKAINEDTDSNLFFGTDGQGVYKFDGKEFEQVKGLTGKYIRAIEKDKNGNLWFATAGAGLYKMNFDKSKYKLLNITISDGLLNNRITCLHYDKQNRLWYGTENNGIGFIVNDVVQKKYFSFHNGLQSNSIRCIVEDESGYLWFGTAGYGIALMPLYQGDFKITTYNHTQGLVSSNVYLMCIDNYNNLFVGTETGLDYLYLNKERKPIEIKHYGKGEGFTGIETCQNSVFKDDDGTIWFGTINCLSKYNPANSVRNQNAPITNITDVKLFYVSIVNTPYKRFAGDWNSVSYMDLPYNQNHLTFEFSSINFSNPDAVKYQWKLEGFDKDWSPVSKNHSISYSNIGAGDYIFMVKACNEDGVWNKIPVKLKFHISAPFWKRWWFIASVIIFVLGLFFYVFKWRENRIKAMEYEKQKKLKLEKEVLELEQKALRLQMNPHFIFNALNSIQSQIGNNNEQVARYYLAKFSRLMRQILENSRNATITLEEEVNTLENYLLIEKFCNGDRFEYKINVDTAIEKDFIKIPPMLLQPFIENSIKHGLKFSDSEISQGKKGFIEIDFSESNNILECSVNDNGIGRAKSEELNKLSKETYHKSTALFVTQERLGLLKQDENIHYLEIIDLFDKNGNASGTKVIVRIPIV